MILSDYDIPNYTSQVFKCSMCVLDDILVACISVLSLAQVVVVLLDSIILLTVHLIIGAASFFSVYNSHILLYVYFLFVTCLYKLYKYLLCCTNYLF